MREANMAPFTVEEREDIESAGDALETMVTAWRVIVHRHGQDWDALVTVDPTDYVIPKDDWLWVAGLLQERSSNDVDAVNCVMEWMNRGPSAGD